MTRQQNFIDGRLITAADAKPSDTQWTVWTRLSVNTTNVPVRRLTSHRYQEPDQSISDPATCFLLQRRSGENHNAATQTLPEPDRAGLHDDP